MKDNLVLSMSTAFFGRTVPDDVHLLSEGGVFAMEIAGLSVHHIKDYDFNGIKKEAAKCGVEIHSLHMTYANDYDISDIDEERRLRTVDFQKEMMETACDLGVKVLVMHPSCDRVPDCDRPQRLFQAHKSLSVLSDYALSMGMKLAMENLPRYCLCNTPEEAIMMLRSVENLYTTFDMNHFGGFNGSKIDNPGYIYRLESVKPGVLQNVHVSDYNFEDEMHMLPLDGSNDWKSIIKALKETDYEGYFTYELGHRHGVGAGRTPGDVRANFEKLMSL